MSSGFSKPFYPLTYPTPRLATMLFNPPTFASETVHLTAASGVFVRSQGLGSFSKHSQGRALGTAHGFETTDASAAPGWLSAGRPFPFSIGFLAGRMKSLGTELHSLYEPVRRAAPGWLSARARVSLSKHSQGRALGTAHGFETTDAPAAPGWLSAGRPFSFSIGFLAGRMKSLGTELHSLYEPVRRAAPGWLSARARVSLSKQSQDPAATARDYAFSVPESFSPEGYHLPVLADEVVAMMQAGAGKFIIDGTLGGGGHSELFLQAGAKVLGVDRDPEALAHAGERLSAFAPRFSTFQANFSEIPDYSGIRAGELADGLLLDLGVSSRQLDSAPRGFSFMREGPLDMRMGPNAVMTAADLVNTWEESEIARILYTYGEEPRSRRIAAAIVERRSLKPFTTTTELAACIEKAIGRSGKTHPATRSFQAIRMAINEELESLSSILSSAASILKPGGRLLIITFHSLEDRMVKRFLRHHSQPYIDDPTWPEARPNPEYRFQLVTKKAIAPTTKETTANPRARSAKLRVAQLLGSETISA
jgi:16S rRNA (cytosine1402-N4)-methyltransferase